MSGYQKRETLTEIAKKYKEAESCGEEFKKTFFKAVKIGFLGGIGFGTYVAYRTKPRNFKSVSFAIIYTSLLSTITMGAMGIMIGTYNCFKLE